jgi:diguanylate cyclase (GGDEF)-like protein
MHEDPTTELEKLRKHNARLEEDVERLITIDQLTGLYNRNSFSKRVDDHLAAIKSTNGRAAMLEIGISGLPRIAGALGRHASDYVISALAARLNLTSHPTAFCCRLDYRSFAVFIPTVNDPLEALTTAKSLINKLSEPIDWIDRKLSVTVGAGVALSSAQESDAATLMQNASLALRAATGKGGPGYSFFNPTLAQSVRRRSDVQVAIQEGLEQQYFSLAYQPFFDAKSGELAGFEALLRLTHPILGLIFPGEFIPVAEESGLISKLGAWALAEACRSAASWPSHLMVAVNVSPEQFSDGSLLTDVHNALELSSLPAYRLEIEVTESAMLSDGDVILSQVQALRDLGISIVLDDFGTGYSSLSHLWKFPFSKMKIDRAFITALESESRVRGMIASIMDLSRNLNLKVTAEGIENETQAQIMRQMECTYLQGYLCGKPVQAEDVAAIILKRFAESLRTSAAEATAAKAV